MSKELEALKRIRQETCSATYNQDFDKNKCCDIIEQALIKSQEQEKVLKFILKKQVDINEIKILISNLKHCDDVERCKRYNLSRKVGYKLKQEEFGLLKRWLENA